MRSLPQGARFTPAYGNTRDIKDSDELHTASYDTKCLTELIHRCFNILLNQYKLRIKLDDFVRYSVFDKRYLNQNIKLTGFRNSNYLERKGIKKPLST